MRKSLIAVIACLSLTSLLHSQEIKWPVFSVKYDGGLGSEQIEEEEEIEPSSYRHTVTLRIKEELAAALIVNLYTAVSRKEYLLEKGSYTYTYLNPDIAWSITDTIKWYGGFRSKWTIYDEPDSKGLSKDVSSLLAKTNVAVKLLDVLKLSPSVQGAYDLYENEEKSRQTYTFGIGVDASLGSVTVGGNYRGILRYPLGEQSTVLSRFNHEFGMDVSWDPNE